MSNPSQEEDFNVEPHEPIENQALGENLNGVKIPVNKGDRTIKCWNCETIMMIKEGWKVVQCPTCEKVNKMPEEETKQTEVVYNKHINHFDVNMPSVYSVLVCPFCKTDNKIRSTAEHMVCYKCHNSVNLSRQPGLNRINVNADKPNFNSRSISNSNNIPYNNYNASALAKSMRFSDLFFPDPMFYPGYYPINDSYSPMYSYDPYLKQEYMQRKTKHELFLHRMKKDRNNILGVGDYVGHSNTNANVKSQLNSIKGSLGINFSNNRDISTGTGLSNIVSGSNNNNARSIGPVESGFEDKISAIKEKLMRNKKEKNHAIYQNLIVKYK